MILRIIDIEIKALTSKTLKRSACKGLVFLVCLGLFVFNLPNANSVFAQNTPFNKVVELSSELEESSALAYTPRGLFSLSDNKKPEFYRIDPGTGIILQTIIVEDLPFWDKEGIAFDDEYIYLGDFGNNKGSRKDLKIVKIRLSDISDQALQKVKGELIFFHYPQQTDFQIGKKGNAFDCEAFISMGDSLYLFTKQRNNHQTTLYSLPKNAGDFPACRKGSFNVKGRITGAALSPDHKSLLLLGYQKKHQASFLWKFSEFKVGDFFAGKQAYTLISFDLRDWQTEGITFINEDEIFITCEKSDDIAQALYKGSLKALSW